MTSRPSAAATPRPAPRSPQPSGRPASARAWLTLAALAAVFFVITAGSFSSLGLVLPDMVGALGWSWGEAGLGFTVLAVVCGLASYAPAWVIRAFGVRATLASGGAVMAAGFACLASTRGVGPYLVGTGLEGLGFALSAIIPGAFVLSHLFRRPAAPLGLYFTLGGLGGAAGPWLYMAARALGLGWRGYWWTLAGAVLVLGVVAALSVGTRAAAAMRLADGTTETSEVDRPGRDWSVAAALRTGVFWIIVAAYTVNLLVEVTVNGASVEHLRERGVAAAVAGGMLSLQALLGVVARGAGGALAGRIPARRLVAFGLLVQALGTLALASARGYPLMLAYAAGVGAGYGLTYFATTLVLLESFGRRRNLELFSTMCLVSTLASAGPVTAGLLRDRLGGFAPVFWGLAAITAIVFLAVLRLPRTDEAVEFTPG